MLWIAFLALSVAALAPALASLRGGASAGRHSSPLAFYRAQLAELAREQSDQLISPTEYVAARLEVERRLLAAASAPSGPPVSSRRWPALAAFAIAALAACLLYLCVGSPGLPGAPIAARLQHDRSVLASLTSRLPALAADPETWWQAEVIIGSTESDMGDWTKAAAAWNAALAIHFDPTLAAQTAEAETNAHGRVTPQAAALFRSALAAAPLDAPWRAAAKARLQEAAQ